MSIGERIRSLRRARELSLESLGAAAGVSKAYVWKLETNSGCNPSINLLSRLAAGLGVHVSELIPTPPDSAERLSGSYTDKHGNLVPFDVCFTDPRSGAKEDRYQAAMKSMTDAMGSISEMLKDMDALDDSRDLIISLLGGMKLLNFRVIGAITGETTAWLDEASGATEAIIGALEAHPMSKPPTSQLGDGVTYTAEVFVHSHHETGNYLDCDVMAISGGWVSEWLMETLQRDLRDGAHFAPLCKDGLATEEAYCIDFTFSSSYVEDYAEGGTRTITEFEYSEPRLVQGNDHE